MSISSRPVSDSTSQITAMQQSVEPVTSPALAMPRPHMKRRPTIIIPESSETLAEIDDALTPTSFSKAAFAALKSKNGFVLNNINGEFAAAGNDMFRAFDDFRAQPADTIAKFSANSKNMNGYYPDGSHLFGSRIGPSMFANIDKNKMVSHPLPEPVEAKVGMKEAAQTFAGHVDIVLAKVVTALETGLGLSPGKLSAVFQDHETKLSLNHSLPVTQEKLNDWMNIDKLTLTEDGRVEAFLAHQDLVPLSVLIYDDNETNGLEVEFADANGMRTYHPVKLNGEKQKQGVHAVVILGRAMENLTDGLLHGAPHRVVAEPLESGKLFKRTSLNAFVFIGPDLALQPVLTAPDGPHFASMSMQQFFTEHSKIYAEAAQQAAVKELPAEVLGAFPKDAEIVQVQTQTGPAYRRL